MYNVAAMKADLEGAVQAAKDRIKTQFVNAFQTIYANDVVPNRFPENVQGIEQIRLATPQDLKGIYSGPGFYVVLTNRPVEGNSCRLRAGELQAIYRGECATTKKRVASHLFHSQYKHDYQARASRYQDSEKNQGKAFYEPFWPHCLKLDAGGPSGVNIDQEPHRKYQWLVLVHRMNGSSQPVRELAELAFDEAFGHPEASRDA